MRQESLKTELEQKLDSYRKPMEKMFYVFFAIGFFYEYLTSSMLFIPFQNLILSVLSNFPLQVVEILFYGILNLRYLIIFPAIYTVFCEVRGRRNRIILTSLLFIGWFYALYWRSSLEWPVSYAFLVIVACANRDIKKIINISLIIGASVIGISFILSQVGVIDDLVWQRPGEGMRNRHAFGMNYCTNLASHAMFLIFLYMFIKRGKLKIPEYLAIIFLTALNIIFVDGQISAVCVILSLIGCIFVAIFNYKKITVPKRILIVWNILTVSSYIVCATIQFIWAILYKDDPNIWYNKYYSLENRIRTNYLLLKNFPFSWFGTDFLQVGLGWNGETPDYYFWVDCSYTRIYAMYGIVAFVIIMALLTWIVIRLMKRKNYFGVFLMAIIAFDLMIEHHIIEVAYNTFLVLAFANLDTLYNSKEDADSSSSDHPG
ncbi:MAG: hypothetical protein K6A72_10580 [Lachnospiraceae bacterium]|nr:hypothetical protein [Lachnospiraceae bacterium]